MAKWGAKISQEYKDVKTCADKDLVFSSDWNTYRIKQIVRRTISNSVTDVYYHNLGYVPFVWGFLDRGDGVFIADQTAEELMVFGGNSILFNISVGSNTIESYFELQGWDYPPSVTKNIVLIIMENL